MSSSWVPSTAKLGRPAVNGRGPPNKAGQQRPVAVSARGNNNPATNRPSPSQKTTPLLGKAAHKPIFGQDNQSRFQEHRLRNNPLQVVASSGNNADSHGSSRGPLDSHIRKLIERFPDVAQCVTFFQEEIHFYQIMSIDGYLITPRYDKEIAQLRRVVKELTEKGECLVEGNVIRP